MAKKGRELELGSLRVQVDPFILARRILTRQKGFLALVVVLGGLGTVAIYRLTPKKYLSRSSIAIRTERGSESYFRQLVNTAMRDLSSNAELMLIMNELDLFPQTRATLPYELALRRMKRELVLQRSTGVVNVSFESRDPRQAQQVVAFITERVLSTFAKLLDKPKEGEIEALERRIAELEPQLDAARRELYEFKARHPDVAAQERRSVTDDSPLASIHRQIDLAERNLRRCYLGGAALPEPNGPAPKTPRPCLLLSEKEAKRASLLQQLTPQHPTVQRITRDVAQAQAACARARSLRTDDRATGGSPEAQKRCIEDQRNLLTVLSRRKADIEKLAIKKPGLQKAWRELSARVNQLEAELRAVRDSRGKKVEQRFLVANEFQENFTLVDAPRVPTIPHKPKRNQFILIGMAVSAVLGLGTAAVREAFRQGFLDAQEFEDQSGLPLLAVLPEIRE